MKNLLHYPQIEPTQRNNRDEEGREARADYDQDKQANRQSSTKALDNPPKNLICNVYIPRKQVQDTTQWKMSWGPHKGLRTHRPVGVSSKNERGAFIRESSI